jgi:hypothetical protein
LSPRHPPDAHRIVLPYPPLQSVSSVKYLDVNGVDQTLVLGTDYRVLGMGQTFGKGRDRAALRAKLAGPAGRRSLGPHPVYLRL